MNGELSITRLSRTAQTVYEVLVDRTTATADELRDTLGLSHHQIRRALATLAARGLVSGDRHHLTVNPPDVAPNVLLETETELSRARLHALRLAERHRHLSDTQLPPDLVEVVHGSAQITQRAEQIMRTPRHQVCFIDKPPHLPAQAARADGPDGRAHPFPGRTPGSRTRVGAVAAHPPAHRTCLRAYARWIVCVARSVPGVRADPDMSSACRPGRSPCAGSSWTTTRW